MLASEKLWYILASDSQHRPPFISGDRETIYLLVGECLYDRWQENSLLRNRLNPGLIAHLTDIWTEAQFTFIRAVRVQ